jgi:hypothetical protein
MSSPLEKFIIENREKFDSDIPDPRLWEKITEKMDPAVKKSKPVRSITFRRLMGVAATLLLVALTGVIYYSLHKSENSPSIADKKPSRSDSSNNLPIANPSPDSASGIAQTLPVNKNNKVQDVQSPSGPDTSSIKSDLGDNKEMYYYTKLIELKHEELKTLEKDEPLLYKQFSGDVQRLDSVYHSLKTQLPTNSNREQVIEAMISNLQLQIDLLNKQLDIIKKIKHIKKTEYEKAFKSV